MIGYCECGCGSETSISEYNNAMRGWKRGKHKPFIKGHYMRNSFPIGDWFIPNKNNGYCECGCGELAPIAKASSKIHKRIKGHALRFISGHNSRTKESSPNWRGGITPEHRAIRNSKEYADWRQKVFERDDWTCQTCNIRGGIIHAHHIKSFSDYPELRFVLENGVTLCEEHHWDQH